MKDKSISVLWCLAVFYGCQRHDDNSRVYYLSGRLSELATKIESIDKRIGHRIEELGKSVQEIEGRVINEDHPKLNLFGKSSYLIKTKVGYLTLSSQSAVDSNGQLFFHYWWEIRHRWISIIALCPWRWSGRVDNKSLR